MAWTRKLSAPIVLDNGRTFLRLRDAADFALALSDRQKANPAWQYAIRLMMRAAERGSGDQDLKEAERQLDVVLRMDGLLGIRRDRPPSRPLWRRR